MLSKFLLESILDFIRPKNTEEEYKIKVLRHRISTQCSPDHTKFFEDIPETKENNDLVKEIISLRSENLKERLVISLLLNIDYTYLGLTKSQTEKLFTLMYGETKISADKIISIIPAWDQDMLQQVKEKLKRESRESRWLTGLPESNPT